MNLNDKRVVLLGLQVPFLLGLIIYSFFAVMIFFTAVEYTTHSAIQEYVKVNPKADFIKFTVFYLSYGAIVLFFISIRGSYKYFTLIGSMILIIMHSIYFYWSISGTMDVTSTDVYIVRMKYVFNFVNICIITYSLFRIIKERGE